MTYRVSQNYCPFRSSNYDTNETPFTKKQTLATLLFGEHWDQERILLRQLGHNISCVLDCRTTYAVSRNPYPISCLVASQWLIAVDCTLYCRPLQGAESEKAQKVGILCILSINSRHLFRLEKEEKYFQLYFKVLH